jgi:hypothetical protein
MQNLYLINEFYIKIKYNKAAIIVVTDLLAGGRAL